MSRLKLSVAALAAATLLGACGGGGENKPMNYLVPEGPIARQLDNLWNPVFAIATVIFFLVHFLVIYVAVRYRRRTDEDNPKQIHGHNALEIGWTITPFLILVVVGVMTVVNIGRLEAIPKGDDVLRVNVVGHQWWWEFSYPQQGFSTANEMHIPVNKRVDVRVGSADVIHSFWPPKLAGKIDAIPGRINHMEVDTRGVKPGSYWGACAEYCGLSHANMRLQVIVHSEEGYDRWEAGQMRAPNLTLASGSAAARGAELYRAKGCGGCHAIRGYSAGAIGPDLTHYMSRDRFAGAIFANNTQELRAWLRDPPRMKPMMPDNGMGMPNLNLSEDEISDLIAFLQTLK